MSESFFFRDALAKAQGGAGSRGGNVIGRTKSGRPIYGTGHDKTAHLLEKYGQHEPGKRIRSKALGREMGEAHPRYTAEDHRNAASLHGVKASAIGHKKTAQEHSHLAQMHQHAAHFKSDA